MRAFCCLEFGFSCRVASPIVGGELAPDGIVAMVDNDSAENLPPRCVLRFLASRLAPTVRRCGRVGNR
ncbi:hypothetical protein EKG40_00680 [Pseudomonas moorei]|nr:hypothetical protein EKG40_00680 [Pseudomonas moorei]